mgnify:CR=1 FL=1
MDLTTAYDPRLRDHARASAAKLGFSPPEGVYAAVRGPNYETPAEIRFLRAIGADLVGMSTVPEVIAARQLGLRVLAISCVTNMAAGIRPVQLSHKEVLAVGKTVQDRFSALISQIAGRLD